MEETFGERIPPSRSGLLCQSLAYRLPDVTVAYEHQPRSEAGPRRSVLSLLVRWGAPSAVVGGSAVALEWIRFGQSTPSLIDDWFGVAYSRAAAAALAHFHYGSSPVDFVGRYRPAYTGIWNYAQWHLLGAPSVPTAAAWGIARTVAFLLAAGLLALFAFGREPRPTPLVLTLAPLAILLTPQLALDLLRYGPTDPMMVAGLVIGLALIGLGTRDALRSGSARRRLAACGVIVLGYLIYLLGVYSKEASICVIVFAPFFVLWLGPDVRARALRSRTTRSVAAAGGVLLLAPVVHVGFHLARAVLGGHNPYGTANGGLATRAAAAALFPLTGAPSALGTLLWTACIPLAIAFAIVAIRRRDPDRWLLVGILATGYLMTAFSLGHGDTPSRYFIPWVLAVGAVSVRALSATRAAFQVAAALLVLVVGLVGTRGAIGDWSHLERSGSTAVGLAKRSMDAHCPTYLSNFDVERRVAIPRLLSFGGSDPLPPCGAGSKTAYAVNWHGDSVPSPFAGRCRSSWHLVAASAGVELYRCDNLDGRGIPDQDEAASRPRSSVVRLRMPGHGVFPRTFGN